MAYLTGTDLTLGYEGVPVAKHVSFEIQKGDYLCIIGENGAGKSTLLKALLHLNAPLSGKIQYGDGIKENEIGYLSQQTAVQKDFPASVQEIVLSGTLSQASNPFFYGKKERRLAREAMERLSIWNLRKKCYRNLSGGQQQRVLLARALCATKKLLFLDEPVTGLDPKVTQEMYELLAQLHQEGIAICMISHDVETALSYATHILHLKAEKSFFGTREEYLQLGENHG
ncbi:MAG: metal ABC transporter ATP-binding protein [Lachnospiraceae bacterium]